MTNEAGSSADLKAAIQNIIDDDGDITMKEPNWEQLGPDNLKQYLQDLYKQNVYLNKLVNEKKEPIAIKDEMKERPGKEEGEILKLKRPGPFTGKPEELRPFIADMRYYLRHFPRTLEKEESKVAFAATCLEGTARNWFQPILEDHETNGPKGTENNDTTEIYLSYKTFEERLAEMFSDLGEQRILENKLAGLKQQGKCSIYVVKFNELATRLGWDDEPLKKIFYDGLKYEVKEKIHEHRKKETSLAQFQQKAVNADNLLYELRLEKNASGNHKMQERRNENYRANQKKTTTKRQHPIQQLDSLWTNGLRCH